MFRQPLTTAFLVIALFSQLGSAHGEDTAALVAPVKKAHIAIKIDANNNIFMVPEKPKNGGGDEDIGDCSSASPDPNCAPGGSKVSTIYIELHVWDRSARLEIGEALAAGTCQLYGYILVNAKKYPVCLKK